MIDICICTYNARPGSLRRAIASIAAQQHAAGQFRVLVVDNRSRPAVSRDVLEPLRALGIEARIVREERLGIAPARARAIAETDGEWILFVDDDNEIAPDYVAVGAAFVRAHPEAGCFGGKSLLPAGTRVPRWAAPFLPYLAVIDHGAADIIATREGWGPWEPPCAGAWVHRSVLAEFTRRLARDPRGFALGRRGKRGLGSCEDSLMMRGAIRTGRASAYLPALRLVHHIPPRRLRFGYLIRLLCAFGRSHMVLQSILDGGMPAQEDYQGAGAFCALLWRVARRDCPHSVPFALAQIAYHLAARAEYRRQRRSNPLPAAIALAR
jgi:glycosyltransferase involved in cell wall biosynthesis